MSFTDAIEGYMVRLDEPPAHSVVDDANHLYEVEGEKMMRKMYHRPSTGNLGLFFIKDVRAAIVDRVNNTVTVKNKTFNQLMVRGTVVYIDKTKWKTRHLYYVNDGTATLKCTADFNTKVKRFLIKKQEIEALHKSESEIVRNAPDAQHLVGAYLMLTSLQKNFKPFRDIQLGDTVDCCGTYKYYKGKIFYFLDWILADDSDLARKKDVSAICHILELYKKLYID